jgi:hypothetical protein
LQKESCKGLSSWMRVVMGDSPEMAGVRMPSPTSAHVPSSTSMSRHVRSHACLSNASDMRCPHFILPQASSLPAIDGTSLLCAHKNEDRISELTWLPLCELPLISPLLIQCQSQIFIRSGCQCKSTSYPGDHTSKLLLPLCLSTHHRHCSIVRRLVQRRRSLNLP